MASSPYGLKYAHMWACLDCDACETEAAHGIAREEALAHVCRTGHAASVTDTTSEYLVPVAAGVAADPLRYGTSGG